MGIYEPKINYETNIEGSLCRNYAIDKLREELLAMARGLDTEQIVLLHAILKDESGVGDINDFLSLKNAIFVYADSPEEVREFEKSLESGVNKLKEESLKKKLMKTLSEAIEESLRKIKTKDDIEEILKKVGD